MASASPPSPVRPLTTSHQNNLNHTSTHPFLFLYVHIPSFTSTLVIQVGTFRLRGDIAQSAVRSAIQLGYRHIDTAAVYRNEQDIGKALIEVFDTTEVKRTDIFITSKISPKSHGYDTTTQAIHDAITRLFGTDKITPQPYIDLMLIHWPGTQGVVAHDTRNAVNRRETWRAMVDAYRNGLVRAIGVSNYTVLHLNGMEFGYGCGSGDDVGEVMAPMVNQIELHPLVWTPETQALVQTCRDRGIVVAAYASLGEGKLLPSPNPPSPNTTNASDKTTDIINRAVTTVSDIAKRAEPPQSTSTVTIPVTPAQVLLKWGTVHASIVIPKSSTPSRLMENFVAPDIRIRDDDMRQLDTLADVLGAHKFCWDPSKIA